MTTPDEPIHIRPAKVPLSDAGSRRRRLPRTPAKRHKAFRVIGFSVTLAALGALATFVFLYLPQRVEAPSPPTRVGERAPENNQPGLAVDAIVAPFEAADLARARKQAQAKLAEFFELQTRLEEQLNVNAWGAEDLDQIEKRLGKGDELFVEGRYRESLDVYAAAVGGLADLADRGRQRYDAAMADGQSALEALDHRSAVEAFAGALTVRPNDRDAAAGRDRASRLPDVVDLLRQSDRAVLRGDYAVADGYLAEVRALDPATSGLDARASRIADARAAKGRRAMLSEGFGALERGEHDNAVAAFERVLKENPADPDGLAGLQQAKQARLLAEIDRLRDLAEQQESEDLWADALATYDAALDIDPSLRFARDGKARIATRVALIESMARFIDDPGLMSDDTEFAGARKVLAEASADAGGGSRFQAQLATLRAIVERSSTTVPLVIDSDNVTEIAIPKIGNIGTFLRHELMLRPGRYVIVGSRDGYRDVREEMLLEADSTPVEIRCTEPI